MGRTMRIQNQRNRRRGFTIFEVALALTIFMMMTLMFAAVFPVAVRGAQQGNNYNQAALLAQHKIDQLRTAGFSNLDHADLVRLGVIDASPSTSPFSFTAIDNLPGGSGGSGFFPAGTTGTITVSPYPSTTNTVDAVTIKISWPSSALPAGSYSASTMIISMIHN